MKGMIVKYKKGHEEKFMYHSKFEVYMFYATAVFNVVLSVFDAFSKDLVESFLFFAISFFAFIIGRSYERENILLYVIESVVTEDEEDNDESEMS